MKAIITKKALREYLSDYVDNAILQILQNKCGQDKKEELVNPSEIKPTIRSDEDKPIDPIEDWDEQYVESVLRKEIKEMLETEYKIK